MRPLRGRSKVLYTALLVAALAVIVFSVLGIAFVTDTLPGFQSQQTPADRRAQHP